MPVPISILLSTFNGAAYLPAQLASFEAQTRTDWRLIWRDDGSDDGSVALLDAFAARNPGRVERAGGAAHVGVTASYMLLLRHAMEAGGAVVALADQDDSWLPEKLARGLRLLGPEPEPALYCSRQLLVDQGLRRLSESEPIRLIPGIGAALTQNIATGCTVMLNPEAASLVARSTPPPPSLHDWWSYLIVAGAGGRIIVDQRVTVMYRQHGRNAVGAPRSKRHRAIAALRRGPGAFMTVLRAQVAALQAQSALLAPESRGLVDAVAAALASGIMARIRVLRRFRLERQTPAETWLFRCWFLIG